ncbi:hypothetical protein ACFCV3_00335 [Kribbella sp. NPDC056345]|uniref:hypothetical protein n=1 Tax=Kribbella sp. NPDC056345 TaxID=3345789 RepID=UPI0035E2387C
MRTVMAAAVAILMLVVGCSDTPAGNGGSTTPPETTETTTGEPTPEPTTTETTQTKQNKPAISLATAPVGGAPDETGIEQCASVAWLAGDLPDGTVVTFGEVRLEPGDIFELYQQACPGDRRRCPGLTIRANTEPESCYVGAKQVANGTEDPNVVIEAEVTCDTEDDCRKVQKEAKKRGTQVEFITGELPTETVEPTETPETPTDG